MNKLAVKKIISPFKLYSILLLAVFSMSLIWFVLQTFFLTASLTLLLFHVFPFLIDFCKQHYDSIMFWESCSRNWF